MKKIFLVVSLGVCLCLGGCNHQVFGPTYYEEAMIKLPDGTIIQGKVQSWGGGYTEDQIMVKIGGKHYLVHSSNLVLISN